MGLGSISSVDLLTILTPAPISCRILARRATSLIFGIFSIRQTPSARIAAGIMATAAFLAPLTDTSPISRRPPVMINLSNAAHS